jgi:type I restriction enzyme S subunit
MNFEIFFEKFELFAHAPDAVAKMRGLVLQLAVQGKLVDQDRAEEPANTLLDRIKTTKERLISERTIRRQDTDPIGEDEAPFFIPESWTWTRLGEIGDWGSGSTPTRGNPELYGGKIAWLKSGELNDNRALAGSEESVTELAVKTCSFRRNQPGDVLLAMYGATIGKVAILAEPAVTNQAVCGCTPFEGVSNRYLFDFLVSQRARFHAASEGGAQPNISKVKIVAFPIPLPPLAEQKRIVAKVDELMALCARLALQQEERETRHAALSRASLARFADAPTPANLDFLFHKSYAIPPADLRKSILTLAVQGKLVPQDPNDEPAEESTASETPFDLPSSWMWKPLDTIGTCRTGKTPPTNDPANYGAGFPFIGPGQITLAGEIIPSDKEITEVGLCNSTKANADDILMVCIGGSIGKAAICPGILGFNQQINSVRVECDSPAFIFIALTSSYFHDQVLAKASGSATPIINKGKWEQILVPVPPLAEQRRIVAKVKELMALVDALENQLAAARTTAAALIDAAVHELSNGKEAHVLAEV